MRRLIALLMVALVFAVGVLGQVPTQSPLTQDAPPAVPTSSPGRAHELTAADVESFIDGILPLQLKRDDIAGATVAVVKDGKLLTLRERLWLRRRQKQETRFRAGHVIPTRFSFKAVHLDRGHAVV